MGKNKHSLEATLARLADDSFLNRALSDIKLAWWLMLQNDVPLLAKLVPILAVVYVVAPVDVLPDFLPLLGQADDAALLMLGIRTFLRLAPPTVIGRYESDVSRKATVIDHEPPTQTTES